MAVLVVAIRAIPTRIVVVLVRVFQFATSLRAARGALRRHAGTCLKCRPGSAEEQQKTQQDEKNSV
jgi:hypothetical protein